MVCLGETELSKLKEPKLTLMRREQIGFISQAFNLLPSLDAKQNIERPIRLAGNTVDRDWLDQIMTSMGIDDQLRQRPPNSPVASKCEWRLRQS